ncbi:hypothetical protein WICPIJ_004312 [Wickerhamomyces pijperi]|uniref:Uncharacterized protein n=1 Tax=Wickerhamomyces pijperi TaxID=599730 RepID=A0A9P8TNE7_WICPI|nr:hypothetical protein WICPIJ_004312 [Wickerhamomyces pijperi]
MVTSMLDLDIDGLLNESKIKLLTAFNNSTTISDIEATGNSVDDAMDQVDELLDGQMSEFDKALFAEVDKLSNSALHLHQSTIAAAPSAASSASASSEEVDHIMDELSENIRPVSPESLFDDLSVSNSPLLKKDQHSSQNHEAHYSNSQQQQQQQQELEKGLQKIQQYDSLLTNYNALRSEYELKCKELNKVLSIFKEMETKRFELTQENQYLRGALSQLLFRSGQSDINTAPFQL